MFTASENKAVKVWAVDSVLQSYFPDEQPEEGGEVAMRYDMQSSLFLAIRQEELYTTSVECMLVLRGGKEVVTTYTNKAPVIWSLEGEAQRRSLHTSPNHS